MLATFLLTILGTFMTRSGVFNSVHSFTQSAIGPTFLVFLGDRAAVRRWRCSPCASTSSPGAPGSETLLAREGAFLVNNLLFVRSPSRC